MSGAEEGVEEKHRSLRSFVLIAWVLAIANACLVQFAILAPLTASNLPFGLRAHGIAALCFIGCIGVVGYGIALHRPRGWWLLLPLFFLFGFEIYWLVEVGSGLSNCVGPGKICP